jgi:hypothetical protein
MLIMTFSVALEVLAPVVPQGAVEAGPGGDGEFPCTDMGLSIPLLNTC